MARVLSSPHRRLTILVALWVCASGVVRAETPAGTRYTGRPLAAVLDDLRAHGLRIIYSSDRVRPDMIVATEPAPGPPRALLDSLLAPFGLQSRDGPRGTVLVVDSPDGAPAAEGRAPEGPRVPAFREEIEVGSGADSATTDRPETRTTLGADRLAEGARLGDDPGRALERLPGIAAADKSAAFAVRGGRADETQFILDGLVIDDPYHLKDFLSFSSIIDARALQGGDLLSGLFPAEYGGRIGGVVELSTRHPSGPSRSSLTASSLDSSLLTEGGFGDRSGGWLLSTRAWRPDVLVDTVDPGGEGLNPLYYDLLAKAETTLPGGTVLAGHLLAARDSVHADSSPDPGHVTAGDASDYAWVTLKTPWTDRLYSRTVLSLGRSERERHGGFADPGGSTGRIDDERGSSSQGLTQDWLFQSSPGSALGWGLAARRVAAQYDTVSHSLTQDPLFTGGAWVATDTDVRLAPSGTELGAYVTERFRLSRSWGAEVGARWDHQSLTSQAEIGPRVHLVWAAGERSALRFGWGRVYQPQGPQELQAEDGATTFFSAERAEQRTIDFERRFEGGLGLSIGAYAKTIGNVRPRYENLFNPLVVFPEVEPDRVYVDPGSARARGLEIALSRDGGGTLGWRAAYTLASSEEEIDGRMRPRDFDQRHTLDLALHVRPGGGRWDLALAGQYHSGWPTTGVEARAVTNPDGSLTILPTLGPRNAERLPPYERVDLRLSHRLDLDRGSLRLFFEVTNLLGRRNVCCGREFLYVPQPDGSIRVEREDGFWARQLPLVGLTWESRP